MSSKDRVELSVIQKLHKQSKTIRIRGKTSPEKVVLNYRDSKEEGQGVTVTLVPTEITSVLTQIRAVTGPRLDSVIHSITTGRCGQEIISCIEPLFCMGLQKLH